MIKDEALAAGALSGEELESFLKRVQGGVGEVDFRRIELMSRAWPKLLELVESGRLTRSKLQRLLFGPRSEKTRTVCAAPVPPAARRPPCRGHGRRAAKQYTGARRVRVSHPTYKSGQVCQKCQRGKLRAQKKQGLAVRLVGAPPITATVWELEKLRCDTCGEVFTAPTPPEAGTGKYDDSVGVTIGVLRFGTGVPHHRLACLQASLGVPLPESTQWELLVPLAAQVEPVLAELIRQAAQSPVVHHDDTSLRVANLRRPGSIAPLADDPKRTGTFTTNVLAAHSPHPISLFFTGCRHAGENLAEVLKHRTTELAPPIQMCDALSRNRSPKLPTELALCLAHGRREYVEVAKAWPEQSRHVLEQLQIVYHFDAEAKALGLTPAQRLAHHQTHSQPVMAALHQWLLEQVAQKYAEPNSPLGKAFGYLLGHWVGLTLFLRRAGAPLDNNACERALKMAILHRKNSLGYKTLKGAQVGDLFMSIIHTCRLNRENPFDYLLTLARHAEAVRINPAAWLPWNYPRAGRPVESG